MASVGRCSGKISEEVAGLSSLDRANSLSTNEMNFCQGAGITKIKVSVREHRSHLFFQSHRNSVSIKYGQGLRIMPPGELDQSPIENRDYSCPGPITALAQTGSPGKVFKSKRATHPPGRVDPAKAPKVPTAWVPCPRTCQILVSVQISDIHQSQSLTRPQRSPQKDTD